MKVKHLIGILFIIFVCVASYVACVGSFHAGYNAGYRDGNKHGFREGIDTATRMVNEMELKRK